jgi:hypothetical protein
MLKLAVLMPTARPQRATELMQEYARLARGPVRLIVGCPGISGKIAAYNEPVPGDWDILVVTSDDMIPQVEGWDLRIIADMEKHFPDTDGVLWYNDGFTQDRLNTLPIVGRKYYERTGYIYNHSYKSLWADNEFTEVAQRLGRIKYSDDVLFLHDHPANNAAAIYDEVYRSNDAHYAYDRDVYTRRKSLNFDLCA